MDPVLLEKAILERKAVTGKYPKAIVPVALYGRFTLLTVPQLTACPPVRT